MMAKGYKKMFNETKQVLTTIPYPTLSICCHVLANKKRARAWTKHPPLNGFDPILPFVRCDQPSGNQV